MGVKTLFSAIIGLGLATTVSGCDFLDSTMSADEWREAAMEPHLTEYDRLTDKDATIHNCIAVDSGDLTYTLKSWTEDTLLVERLDGDYDGYCLKGLSVADYEGAVNSVHGILQRIRGEGFSESDLGNISISPHITTGEAAAALEESHLIYNFIQENDIDGIDGDDETALISAASVFFEQVEENKNLSRLEGYRAEGILDDVIARYEELRPQAEVVERCPAENDLYAAVATERLPSVVFNYWSDSSRACKGAPRHYDTYRSPTMITPAFSL